MIIYKRPLGFKVQKGIRVPGYHCRCDGWMKRLTAEQYNALSRMADVRATKCELNAQTYLAKYRSLLELTDKETRHLANWMWFDDPELSHELRCDCDDVAHVDELFHERAVFERFLEELEDE